ncbi:MAG: helix-turn-helix transcriptional regulator [Brasilonema angustatum HA4187-MV1]|jgi:DNA-binding Xre family transcriptional regulator|nr:helix-turn-helix transcriptional regulator [Brasilonema angustatum HA4187-MV1]
MPIKNKIKEFITSKEITRYEFAKLTGVSKTTVYSLYDSPDILPLAAVLTKICDYYQVQPNDLMLWEPNTDQSPTAPQK